MATRDEIVNESVAESKDGARRRAMLGITVLLAIFMCTTAVLAWIVYDKYHAAAQRGTNLAEQVRLACSDPTRYTELGNLCNRADKVVEEAPTAPTIQGPKGDTGETGETGPAGPSPSADQVEEAVRSYCSTGVCRGIVTASQVRQAVIRYCSTHDSCRGEEGPPGETGKTTNGENGKDGKDGKDGRDAFPFQFSFTVETLPNQSDTYTCFITDPEISVTCTRS